LIPAQVRGRVLARVGDAQPDDDRERQAGVHERAAEARPRGELTVEVDLIGVAGQEGEPGVVGLAHAPTEVTAVDIADDEILEEAAPPDLWRGFVFGHRNLRSTAIVVLSDISV
jgi:hypothetical protein